MISSYCSVWNVGLKTCYNRVINPFIKKLIRTIIYTTFCLFCMSKQMLNHWMHRSIRKMPAEDIVHKIFLFFFEEFILEGKRIEQVIYRTWKIKQESELHTFRSKCEMVFLSTEWSCCLHQNRISPSFRCHSSLYIHCLMPIHVRGREDGDCSRWKASNPKGCKQKGWP